MARRWAEIESGFLWESASCETEPWFLGPGFRFLIEAEQKTSPNQVPDSTTVDCCTRYDTSSPASAS